MKDLKPFVLFATLLTLLVTFPTPMRIFLHYLTMMEVYARFNPEVFYPLAGILWTVSLYWIAYDHMKSRPREKRFWTVEEAVLNQYNGITVSKELSKPVIVQEFDNENSDA